MCVGDLLIYYLLTLSRRVLHRQLALFYILRSDAPRDMKLSTSNGGRISPMQSEVRFELQPQDSAWIECSAAGNPPPGIRWLLGPNQTLNASAYSVNGSRLVLRDAALLAATGVRFVCEASNTVNSQTKTFILMVTIKNTGESSI